MVFTSESDAAEGSADQEAANNGPSSPASTEVAPAVSNSTADKDPRSDPPQELPEDPTPVDNSSDTVVSTARDEFSASEGKLIEAANSENEPTTEATVSIKSYYTISFNRPDDFD